MKNIVVLASGSGSNFKAIADAVAEGRIQADLKGLVASKPSIGAIEKAEEAGVPWKVVRPGDFPDSESFGQALIETLDTWKPWLIVLAGYLHKIPESVIRRYPARILNIHPSLLPKHGGKGLYGRRVHQSVLDAGDRESGCTVHLVNEVYDDGPVLARKKVPVLPDDTSETLGQRVLEQEHRLYPEVIQSLITKANKRS